MILCCGEALIDMIPSATESGAEGFVPHVGGAVFNTAIALGRLGSSVGLLTGLSSDLFGDQLRRALADSGVDNSYCVTSDLPSTLAFVQLQAGQAQYSFFDENSAGRMLNRADIAPLAPGIRALFFGGISLCSGPSAETSAWLCQTQSADRLVMIDPNIRAGFIKDPASYRARLLEMFAGSDIVKVSDEDLSWLYNGAGRSDDQAAQLLALGPKLLLLTEGSKGARGFRADGSQVQVPAPKVDVVDTVGAGDTFNAGFLAALDQMGSLSKEAIASLSDSALTQALTSGARVAAVTVSRAGANPPWKSEL